MINDIIVSLIEFANRFYTLIVGNKLQALLTYISVWESYSSTLANYVRPIYYICGKPLIIYIVTCFLLILVLRLAMAVINIVGQYVP